MLILKFNLFYFRISKRAMSDPQQSDSGKEDEQQQQPPRKRSRNSSANSGMSYDSAIGDIYFVSTPHSALDLERELLELTSASCEAAAAALSGAVSPDQGQGQQVNRVEIHQALLSLFCLLAVHCKSTSQRLRYSRH